MQRASYALFSSFRAGMPELDDDDDMVAKSPSNSKLKPSTSPGTPALKSKPTLEYRDEEAREIVEALEGKRRQLDEEIGRFKKEKEKEFKLFESELRASKTKNRKDRQGDGDGENDSNGDAIPVVNGTSRGNSSSGTKSSHDNTSAMNESNSLPGPPSRQRTSSISELTGSLNRVDPNGISNSYSSPKDSTSNQSQQSKMLLDRDTQVTRSTHDRDTEFQGVFTPSYLPLIDSKRQSPPQSSSTKTKSKPHLCLTPSPTPSSSSFPPQSSITLARANVTSNPTSALNSKTSSRSSLSSTSLPSALRAPSSGRNKGKKPRSSKRVLFQLATAIVQPTSSYEEPEIDAIPHTVVPTIQNLADTDADTDTSINMTHKPTAEQGATGSSSQSQIDSPSTSNVPNLHKNNLISPPTVSDMGLSKPSNDANADDPESPYLPTEETSYFNLALSETPTITLHGPDTSPTLSEESEDPMFDLDEDLDSPVDKYLEVDDFKEVHILLIRREPIQLTCH
jgi:hypothetical protein